MRALAALVLFALFAPARGADLVVGMSAAISGPSRALGIELYRGASACFAAVNDAGGVAGQHLRIDIRDDGYSPLPAAENTIRLIDQDVFALFGYVGTPTVTRVLPLLEQHRDSSPLLFFPFTGAPVTRQPPYGSYVFNLRASYREETAGLVEHFLAVDRRRIAVFYQVDSYGRAGWDGVRLALARHGLEMAAEATYRRGTGWTASMAEQVQVLRAGNADAVVSIGSYAACAALIRDARDAGWNVPIANVSFAGSESLLELLQAKPSYLQNLINSQVVPSCDADLPAVRDYREIMARRPPAAPPGADLAGYHSPPVSRVSLEGYLDARLFVEVLRRSGPPFARERLVPAAEAIRDYDLGIGVPVSFGPGKHQASGQVYYTEVQGGRFVSLADWSRWRR